MAKATALRKCIKCTSSLDDYDDLLCRRCVKHESVADDDLIRQAGFKILSRPKTGPAIWVYTGSTDHSRGKIHGREYLQERAFWLSMKGK